MSENLPGDAVRPTSQTVGDENNCKCSTCCYELKSKIHLCISPCLTVNNTLSNNASKCQRIRFAFLCPPHGKVAKCATLIIAVAFVWSVLWSFTGPDALPGGSFFGIFTVVITGSLLGWIIQLIRLPSLLGMLLAGCLLRNVPVINVAENINPELSSSLRNIALVIILTLAGLGLDPVALRKLSFGVIRLAFTPCLVETLTVAVASYFILNFPWTWGFMLGFILSAVTPAVIVPCMISLQDKGLGQGKGIPTLVIAASSIDDVLAISGFGIVLGIAFSTGNLALIIVKGPLEALAGVVFGVMFGLVLWYFPHEKHSQKTLMRCVILICGGLFAIFGSRALNISGAGALGCLTLAFVAALRWRKEISLVGEEQQEMPVEKAFSVAWLIFEPLLFGLIGAEVDLSTIDLKTIGLGIAVIFIGLGFRCVAAFLAVFGLGLNLKEKFFIPFAWLPKATVQAAIGSVALDTARSQENVDDEYIRLGIQVLTIAVLVILITAPLGAIAITLTAPCLLKSQRSNQETADVSLINTTDDNQVVLLNTNNSVTSSQTADDAKNNRVTAT